jgi:DNA-binding GntR family transcriptional regulator
MLRTPVNVIPVQQKQIYKSLTQIVIEQLREQIYEGEHAPGTKLNIADIAKQLDISHLPVREALRNLEAEGLIEIHHNRGAVVKSLNAADVREIFLIRAPLEETVAAEAAMRWQVRSELSALERILQQMDKRGGQTADWYRLHHSFHGEIHRLSNLPRIQKLVEVYRGQMRSYVKLYLRSKPLYEQTQAEHHAMMRCLLERDADGIRVIVREHLERPVREILKIMQGEELVVPADAKLPAKRAAGVAFARKAVAGI